MVRVKLAQLRITWQGQKLLTETPKNLKVLDVTVNAARFVSILRRQGILKTFMGISMALVRELYIAEQYVGSNINDFHYGFNNYKNALLKVSKSGKSPKVNQEHFHQHFKLPEHNGMDDWRVTFIDRPDDRKELRRRESFWQYKLNTFFPQGLNERNVPAEYE